MLYAYVHAAPRHSRLALLLYMCTHSSCTHHVRRKLKLDPLSNLSLPTPSLLQFFLIVFAYLAVFVEFFHTKYT